MVSNDGYTSSPNSYFYSFVMFSLQVNTVILILYGLVLILAFIIFTFLIVVSPVSLHNLHCQCKKTPYDLTLSLLCLICSTLLFQAVGTDISAIVYDRILSLYHPSYIDLCIDLMVSENHINIMIMSYLFCYGSLACLIFMW